MKYGSLKLAAYTLVMFSTVGFVAGQIGGRTPGSCLRSFGPKEWSLLAKDFDAETKKKLVDDPDFRKLQIENLRQLLAFACESEKEGFASEAINAEELKTIRSETVAVEYDRWASKAQNSPPFGRITDARIAEFYKIPINKTAFERFLKAKIAILKRGGSDLAKREPTEDEKASAKDLFAKISISETEYNKNAAKLGEPFRSSVELKVRLQQAQFLAREFSDKVLAKKISVTDKEVSDYIASHPGFDIAKKREFATKLLERAKAGEDFAALADQYSDDPGNKGADGTKHGGLYAAVPRGQMVKPFEDVALGLRPGQLSPSLLETDFGYHIIKLDKTSGTGADLKYDVRHILVSTMQKDPDDPSGREVPLREFARKRMGSEKEAPIVAKILADNPIALADYVPPSPTAVTKPVVKRAPVKKPAVRKRRG